MKPARLAHVARREPSRLTMNRATDPVCGMTVDPGSAAGKHEYNGQDLLFLQPALRSEIHRRS